MVKTNDVAAVGRIAKGIKCMKLNAGAYVQGARPLSNETKTIISVTKKGLAKQTPISEFSYTNRNTKGSKLQGTVEGDEVIAFEGIGAEVDLALANPEARTATSAAITNALKDFYIKRRADFDQVVELLQKVARAEAAAEKARQQVLNASKEIEKNQKKKVFASDKLKDAEFLGQDSTLLIVEGNSAMGGMAQARDYKKYGILAIRGKIINCLSNPEEKIFENEEIKLLLSAMNIVPGKYDKNKLRYGRLAICTDADSDK